MWHSIIGAASSLPNQSPLGAFDWDGLSFVGQGQADSKGFRCSVNTASDATIAFIRQIDANNIPIDGISTGSSIFDNNGADTILLWNGGAFSDYQLKTTLTIVSGTGTGGGLFSTRDITASSGINLIGSFDMATLGDECQISVLIESTHIPSSVTRSGTINMSILY